MKTIRSLLILTVVAALISACGSSKEVVDETVMTDKELLKYGDEFLHTGHYEEALAAYQYLLDKFPISDLHIKTQLHMAEAYMKLDKFEEQMEILLRLLRENIIPETVPEIYCQIGKYYERSAEFNPGITTTDTMDYQTAISYYDKALNYQDSDDAVNKAQALYRRALANAKIGEIDKAIQDYQNVTTVYPDGTYSLLAQIKLKDPQNLTELAMDNQAIRSYKEQLGLIAPGEEEQIAPTEEESKVVEEVPEETEYNIDAVIKQAEEEQKVIEEQPPAEEQQLAPEQQEEIVPQEQEQPTVEQETPADTSEQEAPADDSFIQAPADTTSN